MKLLSRVTASAALAILLGMASQVQAAPFTGPISPYYLDNYEEGRIYVVQGASVINSFPTGYANGGLGTPYQEGNLAVTNVVSTNWFGRNYGLAGAAGQYTLAGVPTATSWANTPPPPEEPGNSIYDGTSDGTNNYTVEYRGSDGSGNYTENVIQTDANWQSTITLFSVQSWPGAFDEYVGITYDPTNNSLWVGAWGGSGLIRDYDLTGNLLSSFTATGSIAALAYDSADNTLWYSDAATHHLYQYSTAGVLLQDGFPTGLPSGHYLAGDMAETPEPASLALLGAGLAGVGVLRRRKRA